MSVAEPFHTLLRAHAWFPWWRVECLRARAHWLFSRRERAHQRVLARWRQEDRYVEVLFAAALKRDSNCVDVGCHSGMMLRRMLRIAPEGHHLAIEPIPELADRLRERFPTVTVHEAALGDAPGMATFDLVVEDLALSSLCLHPGVRAKHTVRPIPVQVHRLDDLVPADMRVDLIKVDVEGAELSVLLGARETLHRCRPVVLLESSAGASSGGSVWDLLQGCGLTIFGLDGSGPTTRVDFSQHVGNYLARPW